MEIKTLPINEADGSFYQSWLIKVRTEDGQVKTLGFSAGYKTKEEAEDPVISRDKLLNIVLSVSDALQKGPDGLFG
jgi:hypothetical protein